MARSSGLVSDVWDFGEGRKDSSSGTPLLELISSVSLCEFGLAGEEREEECAKSSD